MSRREVSKNRIVSTFQELTCFLKGIINSTWLFLENWHIFLSLLHWEEIISFFFLSGKIIATRKKLKLHIWCIIAAHIFYFLNWHCSEYEVNNEFLLVCFFVHPKRITLPRTTSLTYVRLTDLIGKGCQLGGLKDWHSLSDTQGMNTPSKGQHLLALVICRDEEIKSQYGLSITFSKWCSTVFRTFWFLNLSQTI